MNKLFLLKNHQKRLLQGHAWIYSNEIDTKRSPLKRFSAGECVEVCDASSACLGIAYVNPHSLIAARLLTREKILAENWLLSRLKSALAYREHFYAEPYYRLVYGESDQLPGLVIDRYGDDFVVQVNTAGMEAQLEKIAEALLAVCSPRSIHLRADSSMRDLENLPKYTKDLYGASPEVLSLIENKTLFEIPQSTSQKTGWFYDHRENRALLQKIAPGKKILDVFSYLGGWGVEAAKAGASHVTCVDASLPAMQALQQNAVLNQVQDRVNTLHSDAFEAMTQLKNSGETFDIVVLDPPAFIKRRKDQEQGMAAYYRINQQALRLLRAGGVLISASCSHHLAESDLQQIISKSLTQAGKSARLFSRGQVGFDHPSQPSMPETQYLKAFFLEI